MRCQFNLNLICSFAALAVVAACAPAGYYDSTGVYHSYGASDAYRTNTPRDNSAVPGTVQAAPYQSTPGGYQPAPAGYSNEGYNSYPNQAPANTVTYDRPGFYDYNGYYISADSSPSVPTNFLPPDGMCRIWFSDRSLSDEPPVESCNGIQRRVPAGAYVIFGG